LIAFKNIGLSSESILLQIANDIYFYSKEAKEFYLANINEQSIFAKIDNYTKTGDNEIILGNNTTKYFSYVDKEKTGIKFYTTNNYLYPASIKLDYLYDMYFHKLGLILNFGGNIYYYNMKTKLLTNIKSGLEVYKLDKLSIIDKKCLDIVNTDINTEPNPANSEIMIKYSDFDKYRYNFSLVNSTGIEIFNAWNSRKICLNSVKSGFYHLIIRSQKGNVIKVDKIFVTR